MHYRKDGKKYGAALSAQQKERMVDSTKGSDFAKHLAKDAKPLIVAARWHTDKDGNTFTELALEGRKGGAKSFLTPQGGLGDKHFTDDMRQAILDNGIASGDLKSGAGFASIKPVPMQEYPKGRAAVTVGYGFKAADMKPMTPAVKASVAKRNDLVDEAGKIDPAKAKDGVNARFREIMNTEPEPAKEIEAPAPEPEPEQVEQVEQAEEKAPEAPKKSEAMAELESLEKAHRLVAHTTEKGSITVMDLDADPAAPWVNGLTNAEKQAIANAPEGVVLANPEAPAESYTQVSIANGQFGPTRSPQASFEAVDNRYKGVVEASREARAEAAKADAELQGKIDALAAEADEPEKGAEEEAELG